MIKRFISGKHDVEVLNKHLKELEDLHIKSVLILAGEDNTFASDNYDPVLTTSSLNIIGGIFPEVLYEGQRYTSGTIIIGFEKEIHTEVVRDFSEEAMTTFSMEKLENIDPEGKTIFVFIDAFTKNKNNLTDALYNSFGTIANYIGGGAGSLNFTSFPCLFSNEGLIKGGAIIGIIDLSSTIGVAHGWQPISQPLKVTEAEENRTISLDWQNATTKYREIVKDHISKEISETPFFDLTKHYPIGITKFGSEMIVRDAFKEEDGAIFTLDEIEEGSHVHILYGNLEALLSGAKEARHRAFNKENHQEGDVLIIDCISRVLFMAEDFHKEILELDPEKSGFGALTLGEIANNGEAYLEIFNKTAIVCRLNE